MGGGTEGGESKGLGKIGGKGGKTGWQRWFFYRYRGCWSLFVGVLDQS